MLLDIHVKGKIIIVQIEANLEPDKLEILNFEIRNICKQKKYKSPKILFIIPSLYPETITDENLKLLFDFKNYKELKIESQNIKILSQCDSLLEVVQANDEYKHFEIVSNLIDGVQKLNQDLTSKKTIKISKLTIDSSFIYDLYDKKGNIIIPSFTKITQDILGYLQENKIKNLVYYSEENLEDIIKEQQKPHVINKELEKVISTFEPVSEDIDMIKSLNDKIKLFFKKLKKYSVLVISTNSNNNKIIYNALNPYLNIIFLDNLDTINNLEGGKFISIFLDSSLSDPSAINLLKKIKMNNSLENTNIIITAEELTTDMLFELKKEGSDNILYSPLSKSKILAKVFESISSDLV